MKEKESILLLFLREYVLLFKYFIIYAITVVTIFHPSLPPPSPKAIPTELAMSMGHAYTPFGYSLHLLSISPHPPSLPSHCCQSVPCFYASSSLFLLVYFVYSIPFISEIIWYLSFTDWLISLSIILSSSIHSVQKSKSDFFFTAV